MPWKRFAITHNEADIVKFALKIFIQDCEEAMRTDVIKVVPIYKASAENLLKRLEEYPFWQEK